MKRLIGKSFIVIAVLVATLFTGCELNSDNDRFDTDAEEILDNKTWYYVDKTTELYKKIVFENGNATVYKYDDKEMTSLKETKRLRVDFLDKNEFVIQSNDETYDGCKVGTCSNGDFMITTCYGDKRPLCGWVSKSQAIADDARAR